MQAGQVTVPRAVTLAFGLGTLFDLLARVPVYAIFYDQSSPLGVLSAHEKFLYLPWQLFPWPLAFGLHLLIAFGLCLGRWPRTFLALNLFFSLSFFYRSEAGNFAGNGIVFYMQFLVLGYLCVREELVDFRRLLFFQGGCIYLFSFLHKITTPHWRDLSILGDAFRDYYYATDLAHRLADSFLPPLLSLGILVLQLTSGAVLIYLALTDERPRLRRLILLLPGIFHLTTPIFLKGRALGVLTLVSLVPLFYLPIPLRRPGRLTLAGMAFILSFNVFGLFSKRWLPFPFAQRWAMMSGQPSAQNFHAVVKNETGGVLLSSLGREVDHPEWKWVFRRLGLPGQRRALADYLCRRESVKGVSISVTLEDGTVTVADELACL